MKRRNPEATRLEADYISRLKSSFAELESAEPAEILQDVCQHIEDALAESELDEVSLVQMAQALENLGQPESIAQGMSAEGEAERIKPTPAKKSGAPKRSFPGGKATLALVALLLLGNALLIQHLLGLIEKERVPDAELVIVSHSPGGQVDPASASVIEIEFGAAINPTTVSDNSIRLTPHVPGKAFLENERFLKFQLTEPLAYATKYEVSISQSLRGRRREKASAESFEFSTTGLSLNSIIQSGIEKDGTYLTFAFNLPVAPEELGRSLDLLYPNDEQVEFEPVGAVPSKEVRVRIPSVKFGEITAVLKPGLLSVAGPLPMEMKRRFGKTVPAPKYPGAIAVTVQIKPTLGFNSMKAAYMNGRSVIDISFNAGVDIKSARSSIVVSPDVEPTFERSYRGVRILGKFEPARRYSVTLKKGLSAFDAGMLQEDVTRAVFFPDKNPELAFSFGGGYLSPEGMVKIPVHSVNLSKAHLRAWRLYEFNVVEYGLRGGSSLRSMPNGVATMILDEEIKLGAERNKEIETLIDLRDFVEGDIRGVYGLEIRSRKNYWRADYAIAVVTDLGISVRLAGDKALVWVTSIETARPVEGASVFIHGAKRQKLGAAVTGPDGVAIIDISGVPEGEGPALVVASTDADLSYLKLSGAMRDRGSAASMGRPYLTKGYEVMAFAERGAYRPQDNVRLSAFVRGADWAAPGKMPVDLTVVKPDGKDFLKRTIMSDESGRLLAEFDIPHDAMTGRYNARYALPGDDKRLGELSFVVAEYIPRTLRMTLNAPEGPQPIEKSIEVKVKAEHLFGDPARGLDVKCVTRFTAGAVSFKQKEWKGYTFGDRRASSSSKTIKLPKQVLDDAGEAVFKITAPSIATPGMIKASIEVEAIEPGGRALSERIRRSFYKWPAYVGVKKPDSLSAGEVGGFGVAVVNPDGTASEKSARFKARLFRITSSYVLKKAGDARFRYEWVTDKALLRTSEGDLVGGRAETQITPEYPGRYELIVTVAGAGPAVVNFYVQGEGGRWGSAEPDKLVLSLDKKEYMAGDKALLEISSPFDGSALITLEKDAVIMRHTVAVKNGRAEYEITVEDDWRPNVYLTATVIRPVGAEKEWMPHRASGVVRLNIDCDDRRLDINIAAAESARPGKTFAVEALVTSDGNPRPGTAVVLAAVDEGVLALTDYQTPLPFDFFYAKRRLDVREYDMYSRLAPVLTKWLAEKEDTPGGGGEAMAAAVGRRLSTIRARRVKTAVLYQGALVADKNGIVRAEFEMPEYIGELRIMVVAANEQAFGSADKALPVKSPLIARASWPRFLAPGDSFELPVTLFNRTGSDGEVSVTVDLDGPLQTMDKLPLSIFVADGEEKTVHIKMKATGVGKADARIKASLGDESYGESVELPVRPAAGFARKGTHFEIDAGAVKTIELPSGFVAGTEKVSLTIAASPVMELAGALDYLMRYPYGCVEQTTSGLAPLIYLRDLAELTMPGAIGQSDVDKLVNARYDRLWRMQTYSGGLSNWPGSRKPSPWGSVYAADILLEARRGGHDVPAGLLDPLLGYLRKSVGSWVKDDNKLGYAAYACYVLSRSGEPPITWIATLEERVRDRREKKLSVPSTAVMHLAAAYLALGETEAAKTLALSTEPSTTVRMTGGYLDSPVRELAITLLVMLDVDPESERIPLLAGKLRKETKLGRWGTTQENAFALMALGKMARRRGVAQSGVVTLTMPDGSTKTADAKQGIRVDEIGQGQSITIKFEGKGKVFGYVNGEGTPSDGIVKEEDSGITIRRIFMRPGNAKPVDPRSLKQGELYTTRLQIHTNQRIENVVIMDLLPAGLEIENPELKGSAVVGSRAPGRPFRKMAPDHVERRDDRMIVFGTLEAGVNVFDYVTRAVTPGDYVLPAVEASCMYDPDTFSVNGRGEVVVSP